MPTYRDLYQEHLLTVIDAGGTDADMEIAVEEYNHLGSPLFMGGTLSMEWMIKTKLPCNRCGVPFVAPHNDDEGPSLLDEVLCPTCRETT